MKINGVYVSCYKYDLPLTRACVASIRFWYPDIPIWLIKDEQYGHFCTREIERNWNACVHAENNPQKFGWGMGKLEILLLPERSRCLLLDSDIVFAGRVLDELERFDEDFVVHREDCDATKIEKLYFSLPMLQQLQPDFDYPGYCFNTGQVLATTGILRREDFDPFVDWKSSRIRQPEIFKMAEQGLLNYVVQRKAQRGELTVRREPFMVWPGEIESASHIRVEDFTAEGRHRQLVHWAGLRWGKTLAQMPCADILLHFEKNYYSRVPFGAWLQHWRKFTSHIQRLVLAPMRKALKDKSRE